MDGPANFAALPNELMAKIVQQPGLKKKEIGRLRLTCKRAYPFATELMIKRKSFTELPVMMSEYSLQTFVGICKKAALGRLVRKIRFSSLRINPAELLSYAGECLKFTGRESPENTNGRCKELETCLARYRDEIALKYLDKVVEQLRPGFRALARYGNPINISISDDENGSVGLGQSFNEWNNSDGWSNDYQNALRVLITAANGSGCEIRGLGLEIDSHRGPESTLVNNFKAREEVQLFLNGLESVRFSFGSAKPSRSCVREMGDIVSRAKSIKRLHYSEHDGRLSFNAVAKAITTTSLEELSLRHLGTVEASLIKVLQQNRGSITKLTIVHCELTKGSWDTVLTYVKDELPSLESLTLENLSQNRSMMVHRRLLLEGRDAIQTDLGSRIP